MLKNWLQNTKLTPMVRGLLHCVYTCFCKNCLYSLLLNHKLCIFSLVVTHQPYLTPLRLTCARNIDESKRKAVVQYLVEEADCDISEYTPPTVWYVCVHTHFYSGVTDDDGNTPLDIVTRLGYTNIAEYLKSIPTQCEHNIIIQCCLIQLLSLYSWHWSTTS